MHEVREGVAIPQHKLVGTLPCPRRSASRTKRACLDVLVRTADPTLSGRCCFSDGGCETVLT